MKYQNSINKCSGTKEENKGLIGSPVTRAVTEFQPSFSSILCLGSSEWAFFYLQYVWKSPVWTCAIQAE